MNESSAKITWLEQLHQVLLRVHLPVREMVLTQGRLRIDFGFRTDRNLTVDIRPRDAASQCFSQTRRYSIGYDGQGPLDRSEQSGLERLVSVLQRIENRLPEKWQGTAGVFLPSTPRSERFLRTFPICTVERSQVGESWLTEVLVRTTSRCNQDCLFCTAPIHETPLESDIYALLDELPEAFPHAMLSLTGGEPTLRPSFLREVVSASSREGIASVQVQTNAVLLGSKLDPQLIPVRPHLSFFVSLHDLDPERYDRCTHTRGQLAFALKGIRRLVDGGHRVTINTVVSAINVEHLVDFAKQWPRALPVSDAIDWHLSALICPSGRPEAAEVLVPYPTFVEQLQRAAAIAHQQGIVVQSVRASTHASVPACFLPPEWQEQPFHRPQVLEHETGLLDQQRAWVKAEACSQCIHNAYCLGVPRPYALRFGVRALRPLKPPAELATPTQDRE